MPAWIASVGVKIAMMILRKSFMWFFSVDHAIKMREQFRSTWWAFHERAKASPGSYDDQVSEAVQIFFKFTHTPEEVAQAKLVQEATKAPTDDPTRPTL